MPLLNKHLSLDNNVNKTKKYQLNYNMFYYNAKTRAYQTKDGRNMTYAQAIQNK